MADRIVRRRYTEVADIYISRFGAISAVAPKTCVLWRGISGDARAMCLMSGAVPAI
ncbi:hypothetical protein [Mycobacterium neglectum]|uniref:hypothetical protein n=1 Tax=Mycobacterium neglectum TaxID=242737 RepID=UPI001FE97A7F|nr:hypothetical protein [Mycobacterium neglectum]